jgi:uncharacterized protein (DUF2132 family)
MSSEQANNPLHGLSLEAILVKLQAQYGWDGLAGKISINCFKKDPSLKSSLTFLRKNLWAREQLESLYLATLAKPSQAKPAQAEARAASPWPQR